MKKYIERFLARVRYITLTRLPRVLPYYMGKTGVHRGIHYWVDFQSFFFNELARDKTYNKTFAISED